MNLIGYLITKIYAFRQEIIKAIENYFKNTDEAETHAETQEPSGVSYAGN